MNETHRSLSVCRLVWFNWIVFFCIAGHISSCKLHLQETSQWWYFEPGVQHCTCEFTQPMSGSLHVNLQHQCFYDSYVCVYLQEYKLVITGHSLGAGTASLLAVLLRSTHPTLECYAFSPPGGLLRYYKSHLNIFNWT